MNKPLRITLLGALCMGVFAARTDASIIFTFQQAGGTVTMTPSGTLDTSKLVVSNLPDGWGGTGTESNSPSEIDIMGGTSLGAIDRWFGFHVGTDASALNPGPFAFSNFAAIGIAGTTSFTTYSGISNVRQAGIGLEAADLVGSLWTPNQSWTYAAGATFASLGLTPGTYTVSDVLTSEAITIQVGATAVPEPTSLLLLGSGLTSVVAAARRRRKQQNIQ